MENDKQVQKASKYSIDKIAAKSELATRGLYELGLLKNEKHFTIIYVCQFCGRLINYSSTPCIFCGNYPKTKREVIIAQALSSESMKVDSLLAVSKAVKDGEDLEIVISNLRNLIDETLEDPKKFENYTLLFRLTDLLLGDLDLNSRIEELISKTRIFCSLCGNKIVLADKACFYCVTEKNISDKEAGKMENTLTLFQKNVVAFDNFLLFVENYLDFANDKNTMTELIFVSVYMLNYILEKNELPDIKFKKLWRELLLQSEYFGSDKSLNAAIGIDSDGKPSVSFAKNGVSREAPIEMVKLADSLLFLLKF
ncbi:MAG: hypothetical protein NTZ97_01035 [Candidatus Moranbacteria bacterium]|nr:hypothetical protein [Candidatus Moranbacteria bacterium]